MGKKVVLITGCSDGGIGSSLAKQFSDPKQDFTVYATARSISKLTKLKETSCKLLQLDVTVPESVKTCVQHILEEEGRIDVLINNAGLSLGGPIVELELDQVKNLFDANLFGALDLTKQVSRAMIERKSGCIINVGSVVGDIYTPYTGIYSTSKAALHCLTNVLKLELLPFNIKVLTIKPGNLIENSNYKKVETEVVDRINYSQIYGTYDTDKFAIEVVKFTKLHLNPTSTAILYHLLYNPVKLLLFLLVTPVNLLFHPKVLNYFDNSSWVLPSELVLGGSTQFYYLNKWLPSYLVEAILFITFKLGKLK